MPRTNHELDRIITRSMDESIKGSSIMSSITTAATATSSNRLAPSRPLPLMTPAERSDSITTDTSEQSLQSTDAADHSPSIDTDDDSWSHASPELLIQAHNYNSMSPKSLLLSLSLGQPARPMNMSNNTQQSLSHSFQSINHSFAMNPHPPMFFVQPYIPSHLDPNEVVIGTYTRAQRAAKIARFKQKKANRHFNKKVLYGCRKSFADARPRVGGRFIKLNRDDDNKTIEQQKSSTDSTNEHKSDNQSIKIKKEPVQ